MGVVAPNRHPTTVGVIPRNPFRSAGVAIVVLSMAAAACSLTSDPVGGESSTDPGRSVPSTTEDNRSTEESPDAGGDDESGAGDNDDQSGDADSGGDVDPGAGDGELSPDAVRTLLSELDGQLAIGNGPVVAVARPDGRRFVELDGGRTNLAGQPTWSGDGTKLIWSSVSPLSQQARVQRFDAEGVADGDPLTTNVPGPPIFYFQWRADGGEVVYLRNSTRRPTVEAGVLAPGGLARWMADADPFFVAWAPTEPVIAAHIADERLAVFDPMGAAEFGAIDEESPDSGPAAGGEDPVAGDDLVGGGGFSAPAWLDDTTLVAVVAGALSTIDIESGRSRPSHRHRRADPLRAQPGSLQGGIPGNPHPDR